MLGEHDLHGLTAVPQSSHTELNGLWSFGNYRLESWENGLSVLVFCTRGLEEGPKNVTLQPLVPPAERINILTLSSRENKSGTSQFLSPATDPAL